MAIVLLGAAGLQESLLLGEGAVGAVDTLEAEWWFWDRVVALGGAVRSAGTAQSSKLTNSGHIIIP